MHMFVEDKLYFHYNSPRHTQHFHSAGQPDSVVGIFRSFKTFS